MAWLRIGVRSVSLLGLTLTCFLVYLIGSLLTRPSPVLSARWRSANMAVWSRIVLRIIGARVAVFGTPPEPPFLLVANHLSYVDVAVLASHTGPVFVAKSEVSGWPFLGLLSRSVGTIFVDRRTPKEIPRAQARIDELLAQGQGVVLFPEGTSTPGADVQPFHSALLGGAAKRELPVHWATLSYETPGDEEPAHLAVCWWGDMTLLGHITHLLALKRFRATLVFGTEPVHNRDRKQLAASLHAAVAATFVPIVDGRSHGARAGRTESAAAPTGDGAAAQARRH